MGSAIGEAILQTFAFSSNCAFAQIIPDSTLPNNSRVTTQDNIRTIEGGTQAGSNLFHSFQKFSVPTGGTAFFNNATDIQNIISRVTGGSASNIDGLIRANGTANLFLINPNGIIFGANASLNVGGSFVASTANALQFGNIGFFSATDQNVPSPLLTINPSALLFNQINQNAAIQNNSIAFAGKDPAGFDAFGLRVPDGKSLLLVGGNVSMDGGRLNANGGRVELGGLSEPGTVALGVDGDNLSLMFSENVARTSVSLTNQAAIHVEGTGGGNIAVNARNLEILGGSVLTAGIGQGLGTPETIAGDITLNATGKIKVAGKSTVGNLVRLESKGDGGNITIDSGSFSLQNGAQIAASTLGQGNAGNVTVRAKNAVDLAGNAYIFSTVEAGSVGKGGNIDINATSLSLKDGAQLATATRRASDTQPAGRGDAGNVNVKVTGIVDIAGRKNRFFSGINSLVQTGAVGNGGNITIDSGSFSLRDGALLNASTLGQGNAGNVTVRAKNAISLADANIFSMVGSGGVGKGGNIDINAATLSLIDSANLQTITARASDTQPAGRGDAGNVNVKVTGIVDIAGEKNGFASAIVSRVETGTVGNGGNITIDSGSFSLRDRAFLSAETAGQGNAGNVTVRAKNAVSLAGTAAIFSTVDAGAVGKGGNIDINAASFSLTDGAQLLTATSWASGNQPAGRGNAGNVNVKVSGEVHIAGEKNGFVSGISSRVEEETVGNGGNITIDSGSFSLQDGALLNASTLGQGNAGAIKVNAADFLTISGKSANFTSGLFVNSQSPTGTAGDIIVTSPRVTLDNGGTLNAQSASGNGGDINLQTDLLLLRRGAQISTTAGTAEAGGNGGNITINAPSGFIVAVPSENSDITANAYTGNGGRVDIQAFGIYGIQPRSNPTSLSDITASSEFGVNGTVELNTPDVDPNSGLINLPTVPVNTQVAQTCTAGSAVAKSSFTITGRGGLPPNPGEALSADAVQVDLVTLNPKVGKPSTPAVSTNPINPTQTRIVEATGWVTAANGDVILTSSAPSVTPPSSWQSPADCRVFNQRQGG
ncbi:MAG: filamentous hemagglutinin N-terminal domain-containing protein [Nostoc sp. NOS(2021)]|nr:filamentous hemagglutinin N-terminal domain-containing protein [Nostoc sp. NOS(2021)]